MDDYSIRSTFKADNREDENSTKSSIEDCMLNVKKWMDETHLKMNPSKTEFIYFGYSKQLSKCTIDQISVAGDLILRTNIIRYFGIWMDLGLTYKIHVLKKCKAAMINLVCIRNIRHLLSTDIIESLVLSLCVSHIDYCNALLYGLLAVTINKLQWVQNMCAHLVLRKSKWDSAKECLQDLHWLPVRQQIVFKIALLTHKLLQKKGPKYLQDLIKHSIP